MKKTFLIIDTFNFMHRAYHALPKTFTDSFGNPTNVVYGLSSMLINIFDTLKPDYALAALDSEKPTFRSEDFTAYKAHRKPLETDFASQIFPSFEILDAFNIHKISVDGYEADDIIGTISSKYANDDIKIVIASNDKDLWQLINTNVFVLIPSTSGKAEWVGEKEVRAKLGLSPSQIIDYKGLRGDPSDNIPGVYGVGDKTANSLIAKYGYIENIYTNLKEVSPESLRRKLEESYEIALMSKKLATIDTQVPIVVNMQDFNYSGYASERLKTEFQKYNFKSLIKRLGFTQDSSSSQLGLF